MTTRGTLERADGYEPFFGLSEAPFSLAPDPRFLFASASHSAALAQVAYAVQRREPLVVITGEIGTGKTLLCRTVLQRLQRKTFLSVIDDPLLDRDNLLKQLLRDFGVLSKDRTRLTEASRYELVQTLHAFLGSLSPLEAHAVVIVDEAQHLQPDVLEQIRLLSNIDDERGTLLQIILVGQTDLGPLLSRPELRQLQQRVSRRFVLEPLNRDEVEQYIAHRLALARDGTPASLVAQSQTPGATELARELAEWEGTKQGVDFTPEAIQAVSRLSAGVPRVINLLCDRSLEEAYASRLRIIDGRVIESAARALGIGAQVAPAESASPEIPTAATVAEADGLVSAVPRSEPKTTITIDQPVDEATVAFSPRVRSAAARRLPTYLVLAVSVALIGAALWSGSRRARPPAAETPSSATAPSGTGASGQQPAPAAPAAAEDAGTSTTNAAGSAGAPTPSEAGAATPSPVAPTAAGGLFEIIVASFRTDARATSVAADVAALGLPIRRRVSDGWQQVVTGPFASRTDAEEAQQRLAGAGLTGTRIVVTAR